MILCIEKSSLKVCGELQKDIDLDGLLRDHIKYYDDVESALKDDFVPLDFAISIRSLYSNLAVQYTLQDLELSKRCYINMTKIDVLPHKGVDLVMYLSSIGVMKTVDYRAGFDELMMKSQFQPIGILNLDPDVLNPIVYSHILLPDEVVEDFKSYLKEENEFIPISELQSLGNISPLLESLIEVKKGEEDE